MIEDIVASPLVGCGEIRTLPVVRDERKIELSEAFDHGYQAGRDAVWLDARRAQARYQTRCLVRYEAEYRAHRRRFAFTFTLVATTLFVMLVAIAYLAEVAS